MYKQTHDYLASDSNYLSMFFNPAKDTKIIAIPIINGFQNIQVMLELVTYQERYWLGYTVFPNVIAITLNNPQRDIKILITPNNNPNLYNVLGVFDIDFFSVSACFCRRVVLLRLASFHR